MDDSVLEHNDTQKFIAMYYFFAITSFITLNLTLYLWINRKYCFKNCPKRYSYIRT